MRCTDVIILLYTGGLPCENFGVGIGDRAKVKNSQMTASTFLGRDHRPFNARLGSPIDRGWCPAAAGVRDSYLEINLERDFAFCGIRIQGAAHGHVNSFQLRFARDEEGPFIPFGTVRDDVTTANSLQCRRYFGTGRSIDQVFDSAILYCDWMIDRQRVGAECREVGGEGFVGHLTPTLSANFLSSSCSQFPRWQPNTRMCTRAPIMRLHCRLNLLP